MAIDYTQLAQVRAATTANTDLYQSGPAETVQIFIKICNTTSAPALVRVFHDQNGTTYDETTALVWDMKILPGALLELDHIFFNNAAGHIAYRTSVANALTATVYGVVRT